MFRPPDQVHQAHFEKHMSQCPIFNLPDVESDIEFIDAWAMTINIILSMHQDLGDFLLSHTCVH